jgi:hypothetical protein
MASKTPATAPAAVGFPGGLAVPAFRNEVYRNFQDPAQRAAWERALEQVRRSFPVQAPLVIGGKRVKT